MPAKPLERLFEPFFGGELSRSRLGLAIARGGNVTLRNYFKEAVGQPGAAGRAVDHVQPLASGICQAANCAAGNTLDLTNCVCVMSPTLWYTVAGPNVKKSRPRVVAFGSEESRRL